MKKSVKHHRVDSSIHTELSDRLDPIAVKELRQGMRRMSFILPFLLLQALAIAAMAVEFQIGAAKRDLIPAIGNARMILNAGPFWLTVLISIGVLMPLGGLLLMGQEMEEANHELLLLTKVNRWRVVTGKFFTLWATCMLSLISLAPYVVVRYFIGGIELYQEFACVLTVAMTAAVFCAGAIGVSAIKKLVGKTLCFFLFIASLGLSYLSAMLACMQVVKSRSFFWQQFWLNLNSLCLAFCYVMLGLGLARSRLRLAVYAFEVPPSWMFIGLLVFSPFIIGLTSLFSLGHASFIGSLILVLVVWFADRTPRAAKSFYNSKLKS